MSRVLFVCVQNAGRSQMAHALFERMADGRHEARSAGTNPADRVHPEVVEAMAEVGADVGGRTPHRLDEDDVRWTDVVVTMGCGDACPVLPGKRYVDWNLDDPAGRDIGAVRVIRDDIAARVERLVSELDQAGSRSATS
jgi:arsenate reductase